MAGLHQVVQFCAKSLWFFWIAKRIWCRVQLRWRGVQNTVWRSPHGTNTWAANKCEFWILRMRLHKHRTLKMGKMMPKASCFFRVIFFSDFKHLNLLMAPWSKFYPTTQKRATTLPTAMLRVLPQQGRLEVVSSSLLWSLKEYHGKI